MEPKFNTSFIPKKSLQADVAEGVPGKYVNRRSSYGPGFVLALVIFFAVLVAAAVLFMYRINLSRSIDEKVAVLEGNRDAFSPEDIKDLARIDLKLREAKRIITTHVAVSEVLDLVSDLTARDVYYGKFTYTSGGKDTTSPSISLDGKAATTQLAALQVSQFETSPYLHDVTTSKVEAPQENVAADDTATASFDIKATIDSRLVSFDAALESGRRDPLLKNVISPPLPVAAAPDGETEGTTTATTTNEQ